MTLGNSDADAELVERYLAGDMAAFDELMIRYERHVYRVCYRFVENRDDAMDLAQEVFIKAFEHLGTFRRESSLKTWLFSITVNVCRTRLQRQKRSQRLKQVLSGILRVQSTPSVEENAMTNESDQALWSLIHSMDEKHRIPIVLRYYHDLSVAEIASILQIPEGTVHSRLNTARRHLHSVLKEGSS